MFIDQLDFDFPEELIASEPVAEPRVMWVENQRPNEINREQLLEKFAPGDLLVINESRVLKRRVFIAKDIEILFLKQIDKQKWQVLMPTRKLKGGEFNLPGGVKAQLVEKGRPQTIEVSEELSEVYFEENGELPLPPYIQKVRDERKPVSEDKDWYQTDWAKKPGSLAAPTASFHFTQEHLMKLKDKGVKVAKLTLHVGLGTFLPIGCEDLKDHVMHSETVEVPHETWQAVKSCEGKVWALGTTVTRSLESCAAGMLSESESGFFGETDLFISPGFEYKVVDHLMTNFHQPKTTLLALVMAFAGEKTVKECYEWAIENKFRLFSYGDLSVWN